jgi:5-methyltetrahydropteroyltriglutamate--homocysteine methyltransferase
MYRADHIGSLLRPAELEQFPASDAERHAVEDAAIKRAVALQRELGLSIVTDGEFRRSDTVALFSDAAGAHRKVEVEVRFLQTLLGHSPEKSGVPFKISLPAPSTLPAPMGGDVRREAQGLLSAGVTYVQLQSTAYSRALAESAAAELEDMIAADIAALEGLIRPAGACLALYVGRGSAPRVGLFDEAHASFAEQLFATMPVDRFVLDVDDEPSAGFSGLRHVPLGKAVALGLVSARTPQLEVRDAILDRLDEAAAHFDGSRLAVCPQSGFANSGLSEDDQRRKLELIVGISTRYWGFEA